MAPVHCATPLQLEDSPPGVRTPPMMSYQCRGPRNGLHPADATGTRKGPRDCAPPRWPEDTVSEHPVPDLAYQSALLRIRDMNQARLEVVIGHQFRDQVAQGL